MLKSLYSGVSGMKNLQTKMDVISNNIANVNTTGFKTGRVRFEDMISQTISNAQTNVNAKQVGLGVQVGSVDNVMGGGNLQSTGRDLDFAIENGDNSFFTVSPDGEDEAVFYTRDGGFYLNPNNELVTASGYHVMGVMAPAGTKNDATFDIGTIEYDAAAGMSKVEIPKMMVDDNEEAQPLDSYSIDSTGIIFGVYNGTSYIVGQVSLTNFSNPGGLEKIGGNMYQATNNSGEAQVGGAHQDGYGTIRSGFLEMSNVDLSNEFTEMIVASRAYQANSRSITTSDQMIEELLSLKR